MSERGVFAVDRGVFGHPRFKDEPFTEREAWLWLVSEAAFRPYLRRVGSARVQLNRGQLAHSTRFMADKWKWATTTVRRYLARLASVIDADEPMIKTTTDAGVTVITINNYDAYQTVVRFAAAPELPRSVRRKSSLVTEVAHLMAHQRRSQRFQLKSEFRTPP